MEMVRKRLSHLYKAIMLVNGRGRSYLAPESGLLNTYCAASEDKDMAQWQGWGENVLSTSFCADRKGMVKWRKEDIVHNFFNGNK